MDDNEEAVTAKKAKYFCTELFRKELKGSEALKSLKKFISATRHDEDLIYQYMSRGGSLSEILLLMDGTATGDLTTALAVYEAISLIFLRFHSSDSDYYQQCTEAANSILSTHFPIIQSLLAMNTSKHKKVALKLLTEIVTLHSSFACEVLNLFSPSLASKAELVAHSSEKESVRKYFILFVLSFLVDGNLTVLKTLMDSKGFLSMIIPGMKFDDASTINLILSLIENKILKNDKITKSLKLKVFNTQIVKSLFDLFDWKGPQVSKKYISGIKKKHDLEEINEKEKLIVVKSAHSFLLLLCTSKKYGVSFSDKSLGTANTTNNQLILSVFESIADPLSNAETAEIILKTLINCPDLISPTLHKLEPFFLPRDSENWFEAIDFAKRLIEELNVVHLLKAESEQSLNFISKVIKTLCTPITLFRIVQTGIDNSQSIKVRMWSLRLFLTMFDSAQRVITVFQTDHIGLKKLVYGFISKFVPNTNDVVELWNNVCCDYCSIALSSDIISTFLPVILKTIQMIIECKKNSIESIIDLISNLLNNLNKIKDKVDENSLIDMQSEIVLLAEKDFDLLSSDMDLFKTSLSILLQSFKENSLSFACKILSTLNVFNENKREVDIWLLSFVEVSTAHRHVVIENIIESVESCLKENKTLKGEFFEKSLTEQISVSPFLKQCLNILNNYYENSETDYEKISIFTLYMCNVLLKFQHWYPEIDFYSSCKPFKKILGKNIIKYLKCWSKKTLLSVNFDVFNCPEKKLLASWLIDDSKEWEIQKLFDKNYDVLKSFEYFKLTLSYLVWKINNNCLLECDFEKFSTALSFFIKVDEELNYINDGVLIFHDLKRHSNCFVQCLESVFYNKSLLKAFNIFDEKTKLYSSIISRVFIENKVIKKVIGNKSLVDSWKKKFLKSLKKEFVKNFSIKNAVNFEGVLNFFEYENFEALEILTLLTNVKEYDIFIDKNKPSKWMITLIKFIKIYCNNDDLSLDIVNKLYHIIKYLGIKDNPTAEAMDECFIVLFRKHPKYILLTEKDFVDIILSRKNVSSSTIVLGKLLLNDEVKVHHFYSVAQNYLNSSLIFPLVSALLVENNTYCKEIISKFSLTLFTISSKNNNISSEMLDLLEKIYKYNENNIINALKGYNECNVLNHIAFSQELIRRFTDENLLEGLKKNVLNGRFQIELLFEIVKKSNDEEFVIIFIKGILIMLSQLINNSQNYDEKLWEKNYDIIIEILKQFKNCNWKSIKCTVEWKEFFKTSIRFCLGTSKHSFLLKIVECLIKTFYEVEENDKVLALFFEMVISHSQFLTVFLGSSDVKNELVNLYLTLIQRCTNKMSIKHVPVLLASYTASISCVDLQILKILAFYEKCGFKFNQYEPLVWGEAAVSHYSIKTQAGLSLWQQFNMTNVLDLLDSQKLENSLKEFPINRSFEGEKNFENSSNYGNIYDPAFLLPLFSNLLSPGSIVFPLQFIYKGALAYTVRALSSNCALVRGAASTVLSRFYNHLELSQNLKQKLVWMHFINCIRFGVENLSVQPVSNIITLFLAKMTMELSQPLAELHNPLQKFLLAKCYFTFNTIPEFFPLFHSSEVSFLKHKEWLLNILKDGVKTNMDVKVMFYSMAFKALFCFFHSHLCNIEMKKLILEVLIKLLPIKNSIILISEYGLLNWINSIQISSFPLIGHELLKLLQVANSVIIEDLSNEKSEHSNFLDSIQVLNILSKFLPVIKISKSSEFFDIYLKTILETLVFFINKNKNNWFVLNKQKLKDIIEAGIDILKFDTGKFTSVPFFFQDYQDDSNVIQNLKYVIFLFHELIK